MNRYSQVFLTPAGDDSAAKVYHSRRQKMLKKLQTVGIFAGMDRNPGSEEVFTEIGNKMVQDPAMLFLTGLNEPGCRLILNPLAENAAEREVLFLEEKDAFREFWTGIKVAYSEEGLDEIKKLTGFKTILPKRKFWNYLKKIVEEKSISKLEAFYLDFFFRNKKFQTKDDHNWKFAQELKRKFKGKCQIESLAFKHFMLRAVLDPMRIADSRRAQEWTKNAYEEFLRNFHSFKTERDAALFLNYKMQVQSDGDLAFPTIMACGENACCLHYVKNDEPLQDGKLVLMDFGIRAGTQHSDISRTIPVNGKFNALQKILYEIVLDAQKFHQQQVKPGECLCKLDANVWLFILKALQERFVSLGGKYKLLYDKRPHGVSHLIGEQIHEGDPVRIYRYEPLEPGMLISNEPGLYGYFEIDLNGVHYAENIGIRIENDLLITPNGCEDISKNLPREIAEIEALMTPKK